MLFKRLILLTGAAAVLIFSAIASWYEGAQLIDHPLEWKYTAIVSNWVNGSVITNSADLLAVDHFVYAAKFAPLFPMLMVVSLYFIFALTAVGLFQKNTRMLICMALAGAVACLGLGWRLMSSPTVGLGYLSVLFVFLGILSAGSVLFLNHKRMRVQG